MAFRLLCITAHPDDESGAFAGALLMAHRDGVATSLLCLTDGQAAHYRGGVENDAELGRRRRAELAEACKLLGVTLHEVLAYPDGELLRQDFYALVGQMTERIRRIRPHVVLTFGGDGGVNLHRDHIVVSAAATAAFHWAGRAEYFPEQELEPYRPQKLYYSCAPLVTVRGRPELSNSPTVPYSLSLELGELAENKMQAFRMHRSQAGVLERVKDVVEPLMSTERYLLAARPGTMDVREDKGFFDGVIDD